LRLNINIINNLAEYCNNLSINYRALRQALDAAKQMVENQVGKSTAISIG
jgi:hypothetical protein